MNFRGRTVVVYVLIAMVSTALITLTAADRWLLREDAKLSGAAGAIDGLTSLSSKEIDKLNKVFSLVQSKYYTSVEREDMVDGAIQGMLSSLGDPYTSYMEASDATRFSESIEGSFSGIGAEVTLKDGKVVIMSAMKGSPAERAGLHAKDVVLSADGEPLAGLELSEAVAKIRGPKGTKVKLAIQREGVSQPLELVLIRDDIDVETIQSEMLENGVGYIEIRQFSVNSAERFAEELQSLEEQGMKALVIDVRSNPGGVLPVVVTIAQHFIEEGKTIVQVEDRKGEREKTLSKGGGKEYPIAVLINKGSASASEVLAGALRESAGAVVVGETSYGKGTVQVSYDKLLGDGSLVKLTIAKWLTPDGNWVNEKGLEPDKAVSQPDYYTVARIPRDVTLVPESNGEAVKSLQVMLDALGYEPDRKDGYFSPSTAEALKRFQKDAGITPTGDGDPKTTELLEQKLLEKIISGEQDIQLEEAVQAVQEQLSKS
ncbi:peptidase S41 [Paenibacillus sambharensis]|uniref:Peptidase S41 n=1 Tax=Paenibacillus sambharensis TaxID=1803190 RepID=A0A2W1M2N3_9BACL|nr:S41 family peptidase [Paenibacillus sambharensis]PZD97867.1 peptidase S41 [Paenibacillus sambharensis]